LATPNEQWTPVDWARYYRSHGLAVVPALNGHPKQEWQRYQTEPIPEDRLIAWFMGESIRRIQMFAICGRASNLVVLDCDTEGAEQWWRDLLGPILDETARAMSGGGRGHHYYFKLGDQDQESRASHKDENVKWDLRAEKGGVILPPSPHRSGGVYVWERSLDHLLDWPYPDIPGRGSHSHEGAEPGGDAASLAWLLANPGDGGRNNWVTAVLGHYAKRIPFRDGYGLTAEMVWQAAVGLPADHPYERAEFEATVESVWQTEQSKWADSGPPLPAAGLLSGDGRRMFTVCKSKEQGEYVAQWSQFDMDCKAMVVDTQDRTSYIIDVTRDTASGPDKIEDAVLEAEKLGSNDALSRWFASRRMIVNPPPGDQGAPIARTTRVQMYLETQNPKLVRSSPWMGWYDDEQLGARYVTDHGLIDATGVVENAGLIPDPRHRTQQATWHYGFDDTPEDAAAVLREVMTFHEPVTTSVFGAMWALAPIKGAIMKISSLFPHLAIIAPSEAGKTNGFFDLMLQANGRLSVGGAYTAASLRDDLSVHRGGFVWIDDPSNIDDIGDLLRSAANEGNYSKKGGHNWSETIMIPLVAPIVVSAEGLEMLKERAMADRVIEIDVPSPTGRQSERGGYRQWDDILALQHSIGHLSRYGGHYVQRAFQWLDSIGGEEGMRRLALDLRVGSGRQSEKLALVRMGARALAYVLGDWADHDVRNLPVGGVGEIDPVEIVDAWATGQSALAKRGPYIVSVVLPSYIASKGFIPTFQSVPVEPVWIDKDGRLRVNVSALADWWLKHSRSRSDRDRAQQLGAPAAMKAEAHSLEWGSTAAIKGKRYLMVTEAETKAILAEVGYDWVEVVASVTHPGD
jgi:hypothetical protein